MLSREIPPFLREAMTRGYWNLLPGGDGWTVLTLPNPCPSCGVMHCMHVVRQRADGWWAGCFGCDDQKVTEDLMRSTTRMFEAVK